MERKKKSSNFIIPATFFTSLSPVIKKLAKEAAPPTPQPKVKPVVTPTPKNEVKKPSIKNIKRRTSALSLKSLQEKREVKVVTEVEENFDNHPRTPFNEEQLKEGWKKYYFKLQEIGEKNMASILLAGQPSLKPNFEVLVTLPNKLMKSQLEKGRPALLRFLRERLNNYGIAITIDVNETVEKKFAYTPQEKYNKLKEKNPLLEKLKNTFGLDI
ncbi:hypothetical protein T190820D02B_50056 [Tenacibaculum sp. 190524A05c]